MVMLQMMVQQFFAYSYESKTTAKSIVEQNGKDFQKASSANGMLWEAGFKELVE
jgi:hypothetical protein